MICFTLLGLPVVRYSLHEKYKTVFYKLLLSTSIHLSSANVEVGQSISNSMENDAQHYFYTRLKGSWNGSLINKHLNR